MAIDNYVHLKRAILEIIAAGVCTSKSDIENFVNSSLLASEMEVKFKYDDNITAKFLKNPKMLSSENMRTLRSQNTKAENDDSSSPISKCMEFLIEYEFIRLQFNEQTNEINYVPTRLGQACLGMYLKRSIVIEIIILWYIED